MTWNPLIVAVTLSFICSCGRAEPHSKSPLITEPSDQSKGEPAMSLKIHVFVGSQTFTGTLEDNDATAKFRQMLPLTLDMPDLNANEKHAQLPGPLPIQTIKPGTIQAGDLLLWGDDTLVLFYKSFRSPYSYTRLGKLDNASGLAEAVGTGSVTVTFGLD